MNDPVKGCDVYKNIGCAHIDGFLCDYPNCSILKDYKMNERIKQLARQAGFDVERMEINHANGNPSMAEQFAELILQDCMSICEELGDKGLDGHYCVDKIRKEFGVCPQ